MSTDHATGRAKTELVKITMPKVAITLLITPTIGAKPVNLILRV